jgi:hypothetical protein
LIGVVFSEIADGTKDLGQLHLENKLPVGLLKDLHYMRSEEMLVFHGDDLRKLDFTTLCALQSVIDQFGMEGHLVKFVDVPVRLLRLILPKDLKATILSKDEEGDTLRTVTLEPATWKCRGARASIVAYHSEVFEFSEDHSS